MDGDNERCIILESNNSGTFAANTIYPLNVTYDASTWHTINTSDTIGQFTVDAAGHKVTFSRANIQGNGTNYFLAQHQYHYIGYHNVYGLHDHFAQDDVDTIMGLTQFSGWRLLNVGEFEYILNSRSATNRYAWAIVASVPGIILFPDGYNNNAAGIADFPSGYINYQAVGFDNVVAVEADKWYEHFESLGCVFLPTLNIGGEYSGQVNHQGYYWKQNPGQDPYTDDHQIQFLTGSTIALDLMGYGRASEAYLRPVKNIQSASSN